jgi:hypothetical protein
MNTMILWSKKQRLTERYYNGSISASSYYRRIVALHMIYSTKRIHLVAHKQSTTGQQAEKRLSALTEIKWAKQRTLGTTPEIAAKTLLTVAPSAFDCTC